VKILLSFGEDGSVSFLFDINFFDKKISEYYYQKTIVEVA
jgi:hypothetical protein